MTFLTTFKSGVLLLTSALLVSVVIPASAAQNAFPNGATLLIENNAVFPMNSTSNGEIGVCITNESNTNEQLSVNHIDFGRIESIKVPNTPLSISFKYLTTSSADGRPLDACELGTEFTYEILTNQSFISSSMYLVDVGGDLSTPNIAISEIDDVDDIVGPTFDGPVWVPNGAGLSGVTMEEFDGVLYQAIRGTDNGVYTRTFNDQTFNWNAWIYSGQTLTPVTMVSSDNEEVLFGSLLQAVNGTDGNMYLRYKNNLSDWSPWKRQVGKAQGKIAMEYYGRIVVQSVRGSDNGIYSRWGIDVSTESPYWSPWEFSGFTPSDDIELVEFDGTLVQSVIGTDGNLYIRTYEAAEFENQWTFWKYVTPVTGNISLSVNGSTLIISGINGTQPFSYAVDDLDEFLALSPQQKNQYNIAANVASSSIYHSSIEVRFSNEAGIDYHIQTYTDLSGRIRYRAMASDRQWQSFTPFEGATNQPISLFTYDGRLYQSVIGTDSAVYTRFLAFGVG